MPYSFLFFRVSGSKPTRRRFFRQGTLQSFSQLLSGNVGVAGQTCAFSLRPGATLQTAKELVRFCNSLLSYREPIPSAADKRKLILLVLFDA